MRHTPERHQDAAERTVNDIRSRTRKRYSSEEKIRIVLAGLRGEASIAELCRQQGISQGLYYSWSKEFLEAGKKPAIWHWFALNEERELFSFAGLWRSYRRSIRKTVRPSR